MESIRVEIDGPLAALVAEDGRPVAEAARELMVLELYRRGSISSGKAAELLDMSRWELIRYTSRLGIPFHEMTEDEWRAEVSSHCSTTC